MLKEWQTKEWQNNNGFAGANDHVTFNNFHGSDVDRQRARDIGIIEGQTYIVLHTYVEAWNCTYKFAGIEGNFNSVMFDWIH